MQIEPNNIADDDWDAQLAEYTLGVMEPAAARQFERSLNECRAHVLLAQSYGEVIGALATIVPPAEPPAGHKNRLMSRITSTAQDGASFQSGYADLPRLDTVSPTAEANGPQTKPMPQVPVRSTESSDTKVLDLAAYREKRRVPVIMPFLAAAAAAVVLLVGLWGLSVNNELTQTQKQLQVARNSLNIPAGYIPVTVAGQDPQKGASAVAFVKPDSKEVWLAASGLAAVPPDKVYELWLFPPGQGAAPVPAGTFKPGENGTATQYIVASASANQYAGVAVSLENAPGGASPAGPIVLKGAYTLP